MEKRSALQKAVLISAAAMAVAFAILTFVFHRLEGAEFEGASCGCRFRPMTPP